MSDSKRYSTLVNNTILFAISNFGSKIISLIIQPYLSYALASPDVMGVTSLMQSVANLLIPVVSLGVSFAVIRFGLDRKVDKSSVFMNGLATILLGFALMAVCWPLVRLIPNAADYLVLIYACVLMSCLRTLCTQFIRSRMLNRLVAVDGVLTSATLLGFYYLFLDVLDLGANGYLLAMACSDALSAIFVFIAGHCHQYFSFKKFNKALWKDMLRYCIPMIPASISFWIINASDLFYVQGMCDGIDGKSSTWWVGLLKAGYYLPQIITIVGQIFYEAWQLSAVTEESERSAFFSKVFRVYAAVMFCCVAGVIWLCQPMMHVFREDYFLGWQFVPFLTLASMCTCLNNFLNSVYVVYKRSTSSFYTMLVGAVVNLVLNFLFIRWFGPWGVTMASFISLLIVFLLRAYSTHGLLEIDFHPAWMLLNLGLLFVEIAMLFKLEHWVLPVTVLTFAICLLNFREVFAMVEKLLGMVLHRRKKSN